MLLQSGALPAWLDAANIVGSAFKGAVEPFVLWDILKMVFAAVTVAGLWTLVRRRQA
jgi:biotin transport system substrate-specific component